MNGTESGDVGYHQQLIAKLAEELGPATAQHLVSRLVEAIATPSQVEGVVLLLDELTEISPKVVRAAIESFPELQQRGRLSDAVAWLDLGIALAESSGAIGLKYFKESPLILGLIEESSVRSLVLNTALELAEQDANVALEFLRVSPDVVTVIPSGSARGLVGDRVRTDAGRFCRGTRIHPPNSRGRPRVADPGCQGLGDIRVETDFPE